MILVTLSRCAGLRHSLKALCRDGTLFDNSFGTKCAWLCLFVAQVVMLLLLQTWWIIVCRQLRRSSRKTNWLMWELLSTWHVFACSCHWLSQNISKFGSFGGNSQYFEMTHCVTLIMFGPSWCTFSIHAGLVPVCHMQQKHVLVQLLTCAWLVMKQKMWSRWASDFFSEGRHGGMKIKVGSLTVEVSFTAVCSWSHCLKKLQYYSVLVYGQPPEGCPECS